MKRILIATFALILCAFVFFAIIPQEANAAALLSGDISNWYDDNVSYVLYDSGKLVISGTGTMDNFNVIRCPWENYRNSITSVVIGSGVTNIGSNAFRYCQKLTSVSIADTVTTIGSEAFAGCTSLKKVNIPNSVTSIGSYGFAATGLTSITIPSSILYIDKCTFQSCQKLKSVTIPNSITSIGSNAFRYCAGLKSIALPDKLVSVGDYAFADCTSLTSIEIPASVTDLGSLAFTNCTNLTSATILGDIGDGYGLFCNCTKLKDVVLAKTVTLISSYMFDGCSALKSITIPSSVTCIASYAFRNCTGLSSITIPGRVESFGDCIFYRCTGLTKAVFKSGVLEIPSSAFKECTGLTKVSIPDTVTSIGIGAFFDCSKLASITIPDSVTSINGSAFSGCTSLKSIDLAKTTSLGPYAFKNCTSLKTVTLSNKIQEIGAYTFYGCENMASFTMPNQVKTIGKYAFYHCKSLKKITLPKCIENLEEYTFAYCSSLTKMTLPESLTSIGDYVFSGCTGLSKITIPKAVTSIGEGAFYSCSGLGHITFKGNAPTFDFRTFSELAAICYYPKNSTWTTAVRQDYCGTIFWVQEGKNLTGKLNSKITWSLNDDNILTISGKGKMPDFAAGDLKFAPWYEIRKLVHSVVIKSGITSVGDDAFYRCSDLKSVTLADSIKSIGVGSFMACWSLEKIIIPDKVTSIGTCCFEYCSDLTTVFFGKKVEELGAWAFSDCDSLRKLYFTGNAPSFGWGLFSGETLFGGASLIKIDAYYPKGNKTWTKSVLQDYDGAKITWKTVASYELKNPVVKASNAPSSGKIKLTWGKIDIADEYQIYRATSKSSEYKKIKTTTSTSFTDKDTKAGKKYYYKVRAISEIKGKSGFSTVVSKTCQLAQPAIEVTNTASSGKVMLKWKPVDNASTYYIYRATSKDGKYTKVKSTTSTSYTDSNAKVGKKYYYKVKAIFSNNTSANSAYSKVVDGTCDLKQPDVTAKLSSGKVKLTWKKVSGTKEYKIYRATSKNGTYKCIKTTTSLTYTDKSVKTGKTYYYKVNAIYKSSSANSAYSAVDSVKIK